MRINLFNLYYLSKPMKPAILFDKLYLPVESITPDLEAELRDKLTIDNPAYAQALKFSPWGMVGKSIPKQLTFYDDRNPKYLGIPRGFNFETFSEDHRELVESIPVEDKRLDGKTRMPQVRREDLNEDQWAVVDAVVEHVESEASRGVCLIVLPVSSGKTRICLAIASRLNRKALILCDNNLIAEGWRAEINKLFDWPDTKFKPLKKARFKNKQLPNIGIIKGSKRVYGRCFTICSWQTSNRRDQDFLDHMSKHHPLMFVDEVEVCPTRTFKKSINSFCGQVKIGMTGTDYRSDGLETAMFFEFGNPFIKKISHNTETEVSLPIKDVYTIKTNFNYSYEHGYDYNKYDQECAEDEERLNLIAMYVREAYKRGGHCLVVTNTRNHAKALMAAIGPCDGESTLILGGNHDQEKAKDVLTGKYKIVVSTIKYVFKGVNSPRLDRLFIASMVGNERILTQLMGRVRRKAEGKRYVLVYDFQDKSGCTSHIIKKRKQVYANMGVEKYKNIIFL